MDITYSFKITNIYCYPTYQAVENLAFAVLWEYTGVYEKYSSYVSGNTNIPYDPSAEYTPYRNLTEQEVISWIEQFTEESILQDARQLIEMRILEMSLPPLVINPKLPWDNA